MSLGAGTAGAQTPSPQPSTTTASPTPSPSVTTTPSPEPAPTATAEPRVRGVSRSTLGQAGITVSATDDVFTPETIRIDPGDTVSWSNDGETVHTVTADNGSFDSGTMAAGDTFTFAFRDAGTYSYYCAVHGAAGGVGMAGTVIVGNGAPQTPGEGSDQAPPAPASTAAPASGEALPATGASPFAWLLLGLAHVVSGAGLLLAAHRV
ncbi:MAG: plastocyanin/azurin family copper-binding protein [Actinomycetota bacterium]